MLRKHIRNSLMGIAASLIAAGIAWYVKGPNTGLMILGVGVVILIVAYALGEKPELPSVPPPIQPLHQENKQSINQQFNPQFNPQQNFYIGLPESGPTVVEQEKARQESLVLDYMKTSHPTKGYAVDEIAIDVKLSMRDVWDTLEGLKAKGRVWSTQIHEAKGGAIWFLNELER